MEVIKNLNFEYKRWTIGNIIVGLILLLPIATLIFNLFKSENTSFKYLWENLLLSYSLNTIYLVLISSLSAIIFGVFPAWIISNYSFKYRKTYDILLFLPLSIPTYIMAFTYSDLLSFTGPIQSFSREYFPGFGDIINKDYLQIEILGVLLGLALYPYIYTAARISFNYLGSTYIDVSKTLGLSTLKTFWKVILPLSIPAIISGLFLVIMEVLNEYGAVKYFGVNTYTTGIFRAWFSMGETQTAIQLACLLLFFVLILFLIEKKLTSKNKFFYPLNSRIQKLNKINKKNLIISHIICLFPILFGFIVPVIFLINNSLSIINTINFNELSILLINSLSVSGLSSFLIVLIALIFIFVENISKSKINKLITQFISLGYALPGAVIGLGLIIFFSNLQKSFLSISLIGSFFILIYAYIVRFLAVGISPIRSNTKKHPDTINEVAITLGLSPLKMLQKIYLPINKFALISAFILTFVDLLKELPITLILRPFNFDTLATQTYQFAIEEMLRESSIYSLSIIFLGCIMLLILKKILNKQLDVS